MLVIQPLSTPGLLLCLRPVAILLSLQLEETVRPSPRTSNVTRTCGQETFSLIFGDAEGAEVAGLNVCRDKLQRARVNAHATPLSQGMGKWMPLPYLSQRILQLRDGLDPCFRFCLILARGRNLNLGMYSRAAPARP